VITLRRTGVDDVIATVNGFSATFDMDDFDEILLVGHAHNDRITVTGELPVRMEGGAGNDTLTGGDTVDELFGDSGDDRIFGRGGGDFLFGGFGRDVLDGGDDSDSHIAIGDNVADTVIGGPGDEDFARVDTVDEHSGIEDLSFS
jgi:Ca2+-binding RTX toxin-like protein